MEDLFFFCCLKSDKISKETKEKIRIAYHAQDDDLVIELLALDGLTPADIFIPDL